MTLLALPLAAALHLGPCTIAGAKARCGTFNVPESPRSNRTLALKVIVIPATVRNESPVFVFGGGPGEPVTPGADVAVKVFGAERRRHDIVLVDERGAGGSAPLECPKALAKHDRELIGGDLFPPAFVADCRREIEPRADLSAYTFPYFVDDVDALRAALGYPKINIVALSYGTRAALTFLERHANAARALLLLGPLPPENVMPLQAARDAQAAFDRLAAVCAADKSCAASFPDMRGDLARTVAALTKKPAEVDSGGYHLRITRGGFGEFLRSSMYSASRQAVVPLLVHLAAAGEWQSLAPLWIRYRKGWHDDAGIFLSITCPTDVRWIDRSAIAAATANTFGGDDRVRRQLAACEQWTPGRAPRVAVPRDSGVPILVITGDRDPVTPPRWAEALERDAARVRTVVLANNGHVDPSQCALDLEVRFIDDGSFDHLDDACAKALSNPPFATKLP